ncbi:hypothetical protein BO82DRAFT_349541 [Aspergillus uvarum CBS 121591]|uniref:F-box domain-containing protein n=1 Tax=Aspergillus uvarum CBS 121591 TaxID=1448315 RepID=A0A319E7E8_9EURO|nr:hypothetical protein BO82DRAFT_349541 [Aspergillus uvarum CBS 121591]PYH87002.1 hypothetical protein BO82DRAFT_349541 [Aspergillus uvarum CBS 121591]
MASGLAYRFDRPGENLLHPHSSMSRARLNEIIRLYRTQYQERQPRRQPSCWHPPPSRPLWPSLPLEIVHMIFLHLDMITLGTLRLVDSIIRRQVDSLYEYRMLRAHAAETLKILDIAQCTHCFPAHQLYREFCHPRCRTCPDFGPYLYIPTLSRVCLQCVLRHDRYRVAALDVVFACFPYSRGDWWDLPVVCCLDLLEGQYISEMLIDVAQARLMYQQQQQQQQSGSSREEPAAQEWSYRLQDTYQRRLRSTVAFPCWDPHARIAEPGVYCYGCTKYWEISRGKSRRNPRNRQKHYAWNTRSPGSKGVDRAFRVPDLPQHFSTCPHVVSRLRKGEDHTALRFGESVGRIIRVDAGGEKGAGRSARVGKK